MAYYDEKLRELYLQKSQKSRLQTMEQELTRQRNVLSQKVQELSKIKEKEQADVDKLERNSLKALICQLAGNKEEKLSKEKQEAYAAAMKYESGKRELEAVIADLEHCKAELQKLEESEDEYKSLMEQKKNSIKLSGGIHGEKILEWEEKLAELEHEIRELNEAITAGEAAQNIAQKIVSELTEADDLADWDMWMDSMWLDMNKHEHIHSAQGYVSTLQTELRRFHTELADVKINGDITIEMDDFSEFADWFFDNIFTDMNMKEKIENSLNQARATEGEIYQTLQRLNGMKTDRISQQDDAQAQLEKLVVEA